MYQQTGDAGAARQEYRIASEPFRYRGDWSGTQKAKLHRQYLHKSPVAVV